MKSKRSIIVATAENNCIGDKNDLPWHIPEDLKRFKAITTGKPCIMGRKTFESIVDRIGKPLPGRPNIVVTRNPQSLSSFLSHDNLYLASTLEGAVEKAETLLGEGNEIIIMGGAQIYEQSLALANFLYLTKVKQTVNGDAFFPEIREEEWREVHSEERDGYSFIDLERIQT